MVSFSGYLEQAQWLAMGRVHRPDFAANRVASALFFDFF
jgi:hypothetical protein